MNSSRVLLVGGGLTSALTASMLAEKIPHLEVAIWDKARGAGGRMATSRSPKNSNCTVDLGAQYISATPHFQCSHGEIYKELVNNGVLVPMDISMVQGMHAPRQGEEGTNHYVAPNGVSNIVKYFFKKSGVDVQFNRRIMEVTQSGSKWLVKTECGKEDFFDMVLLTLPIPQLLGLNGDVKTLINQNPEVLTNLQKVSYSTRFVLGLFFNRQVDLGVQWASNYIYNDPVIRFVSVDNIKRGKPDLPTSVIVHTTVPFGLKNIKATPEEMKPTLLAAVKTMFPEWPEPEDVKSLKWLYSQVHHPYHGTPGSLELSTAPLLLAGGDAFTSSNFDGCVDSALSILERVTKCIADK
eukprot:GFUD01003591.1.p1 GENE.GFUD01003591.1~~GFUD01003591.1.p1  ORF type:complete len:352 (-),score=66.80 GFUD01003591.1:160-1215(-)